MHVSVHNYRMQRSTEHSDNVPSQPTDIVTQKQSIGGEGGPVLETVCHCFCRYCYYNSHRYAYLLSRSGRMPSIQANVFAWLLVTMIR